ncbi:MAG: tetratricopeptide repeat protein, partial [Desulfobacterales bacterium]|nr:tetratricopeptide repeat protein [Desulfobacterales bacterium]
LKSLEYGNWHPLTWLSHMLDYQLYGLNPGNHHITNVLFHILNTLLLFVIFEKVTGHLWRSAFVAILFSLHPMHVESIAWISERKDVLSTFFLMLTIWSYIRYNEKYKTSSYVFAILFYAMGLMSKPMVVTLPFVLLLLDYWPLKRFTIEGKRDPPKIRDHHIHFRLLFEKIPFLLMAIVSSVLTYIAQSRGGAVTSFDTLPFINRVSNAIHSYVHYIYKMIFPSKMAIFYPHPILIPTWMFIINFSIILFLTILFVKLSSRYRYLFVGWFWYLGTLFPVIGIIQIGKQAMADRYTYIPYIGLFIIITWGISDLLERYQWKKKKIAAVTALITILLMTTAWIQTRYWSNNIKLFQHAVEVTKNNSVANQYLGLAYVSNGMIDKGIEHYLLALRVDPHYQIAHNNLGIALARKGRISEAIFHYQEAIRINPKDAKAYNNLGGALLTMGNADDALKQYRKALLLDSNYADAYYNIGIVYHTKGNLTNAISNYMKAIEYSPDNSKAHTNLGVALEMKGKTSKAIKHYEMALRLNTNLPEANYHYANALFKKNKFKESIIYYKKVLEIQPKHSGAKSGLKAAVEKLR